MLHPVSPSHLPARAATGGQPNTLGQQLPSSDGIPSGSSTIKPGNSLFQWVSVKELVFVFVVCSFGVLLFRAKDEFYFVPVWNENLELSDYTNSKFPMDNEKL